MGGSFFSDLVGPKWALITGVVAQGCVGFLMAGVYGILKQPHLVGLFTLIYGVFMSLGEFGPGDNIGLLASKTCATGVRGQYYAFGAAMGKLGAFVGTYVFPYIVQAGGSGDESAQYPFYVSSGLCILSGLIALMLPDVGQDTIKQEDVDFKDYLESKGFDVSQFGLQKAEAADDVERVGEVMETK